VEDSALKAGTGKGETGEDGMLKNGVLKDSALKNSALEDGTAKNSTLKNSALKSGTGRKLRVFLNGDDITDIIRDNRVSVIVPVLAQFDFVQDKVHKIQHEYAGKNSLVVEGRETTSVAFPNADYKFYFDAEINLRARRRLADLQRKGENVPFETVLSQIKERDRLDFERELSPLIKVPDAIEIDGTGKTPNEMLDEILVYIKK
jgi:cytidylate kinase